MVRAVRRGPGCGGGMIRVWEVAVWASEGRRGPPARRPETERPQGPCSPVPERGLHLHSSPQAQPAQALSRGDT